MNGCSKKITKEHFVSRNILERVTSNTLRFQNAGHFFGGKEEVEVGIDDFSAKVLCENHNSSLSVLDTAAGLTFSTIEALANDALAGRASGPGTPSFHISSGIDMERWMIKVYCGLVAAKKIKSVSGQVVQRSAIQSCLLESLLGTSSLPDPLGLYMNTFVGQKLKPGGLTFATVKLTDGSDEVGGLILSLGLLNFVLVTSPRYGQSFHNLNWYRHQSLAWNVRHGRARVAYLFTY